MKPTSRGALWSIATLVSVFATSPAVAQDGSVSGIRDAKVRAAVEREIAAAAAKGLPTQPLVSKAMEGVTKQASPDRIHVAVVAVAKRLEKAKELLAPAASVNELSSGADALGVGVPGQMLRQVRATWPRQSIVMPLDVLTELVARGVPAKQALTQITSLMAKGATASQIASFGASVQSDVAAGLTPDAALEVRARGVMSLLPSQAATALLAPTGRQP